MLSNLFSQNLAQVLAPMRPKPTIATLLESASIPLHRGDVLEIQGPPASGKTHLTYLILIDCLIPTAVGPTRLGGWGNAAIVMDTDGAFSVSRLAHLMSSRLARHLPEPDILQQTLAASLARLHIFRPTSSFQLATTLRHLSQYHASRLPHSVIGVVAIDSMSAFYWPDRFTVEQFKLETTTPSKSLPGKTALRKGAPMEYVCTALDALHSSHQPLIVLANWGLYPVKDSTAHTAYYSQHLRPSPTRFVDDSHRQAHATVPVPLTLTLHITMNSHPLVAKQPDSASPPHHQHVDFKALTRTTQTGAQIKSFVLRITQDDMYLI